MIGSPVLHSLSPVVHNAAFAAAGLDWAYVAFDVPAGSGAAAIAAVRTLGIDGLSVTMPHKDDAATAVDDLSETAGRLGAVNTVVRMGERLVGENTDGAGFLDALRDDEGFDAAGRRCVVLGAGGAARAVIDALAQAGAGEVIVVNRTPAAAQRAVRLSAAARVGAAAEAAGADLVVNATPLGMEGTRLPLDPAFLGPGQLVVDLVYDPPVTPLVRAARERGAVAVNGLGMLIHQAAIAFTLWTGEAAPLAAMSAAALAALERRA